MKTLEDDPVFRHAVQYHDGQGYPAPGCEASEKARRRAAEVRDGILELVLAGRLDAVDLKIIAARDCSPMPTLESVAETLGIGLRTVERRVAVIKRILGRR